MADKVSRIVRSRMMSSVRSTNTAPELAVRKCLFSLGFRYRLHRRDLPGCPDLVLPAYSTVIFVHGCFWHQHNCPRATLPQTRRAWWRAKLEGNRRRDEATLQSLTKSGWKVLIIWECAVRRAVKDRPTALNNLANEIVGFLNSRRIANEIPRNSRLKAFDG
jgi:DNA mismatch endonuclease, patch repair protein